MIYVASDRFTLSEWVASHSQQPAISPQWINVTRQSLLLSFSVSSFSAATHSELPSAARWKSLGRRVGPTWNTTLSRCRNYPAGSERLQKLLGISGPGLLLVPGYIISLRVMAWDCIALKPEIQKRQEPIFLRSGPFTLHKGVHLLMFINLIGYRKICGQKIIKWSWKIFQFLHIDSGHYWLIFLSLIIK